MTSRSVHQTLPSSGPGGRRQCPRCSVPDCREPLIPDAWRRRIRYGRWCSRQRPHNAASSSRAPSVEREDQRIAERYGLSVTTVTKWRARTSTADAPMGPRSPRSTVLTFIEEAMIVEFRRRTLLPLDDVRGCLKDGIPNLTVRVSAAARNGKASYRMSRQLGESYEARQIRIDKDWLCTPRSLRTAPG